ncbi:MAG: hypothetical protein AUK54_02760 [Helicobacteraceae bacterium CG2_30_36_10]|nr:MAG: hypothetical protein AUK54_02760 [Helicobacteraceae bacterium CG2_30_36_10]
MKFTLVKDLRKDRVMKPILSGFLVFTLLYLLSDIFVKQSTFGIFPHAIETSLFGNEEEFLDGLSQASFLELWHVEIFFIMMIAFTTSTVYIRLSGASKTALLAVNIMLLTALLSLVTLALAYYLSPHFIYIYVSSFFIWHIVAFFCTLISLKRLHYA